jgi:hypothetical protein
MSSIDQPARKYSPGHRRFTIYVSWSYPAESGAPLHVLDNRFSAMWEVRRVGWPTFEWAADPQTYMQGIDGTLELFFRDWELFQSIVAEVTGHSVPLIQRVDHAGYRHPLDERILGDVDTLLVFSLDHQCTQQQATQDEIEAVRTFLEREGTCLVLGPHHDVGNTDDFQVREIEYRHHGDPLVPRQQRFGTFGLSLLRGLGIPVENRYGLSPARVNGTREPAPLSIARDLDTRRLLEGVTTFVLHPHLPHYEVLDEARDIRVLAKQPINSQAPPHPFTAAGNREFNALLWLPPGNGRAGDVLVVDSTQFTGSLFGSSESLQRFWRNLAAW